jgi:hypothetical protein
VFSPEGLATFCVGNAENGYRLIYNIESYMRLMLRWELVGACGVKWKDALGDVRKKAEGRQSTERELRHISTDERNLLPYTLLSEIAEVMTSSGVWPLFKDAWPRQDLLTADLAVFNAARAKVAHFRQLTDRDMGAIDRFKTIVIDMTAHYRKQRRLQRQLDPANLDLPSRLKQPIKRWAGDTEKDDGRWATVRVRTLPNYAVVDAQLRSGSFTPTAVSRLIDETGIDALFLCLDQGPGSLRAYLPLCLKEDEARALVEGLWSFQAIEDDFQEDEEEAEIFDFVMPIEVELPMDFRQ